MWPKEHGAYAQLAIPLLTALVAARPAVASVAYAAAAVAAFLAHEPAAVLLGVRGTRARREDGARALRSLIVLGVLGMASGVGAMMLSPRSRPFAVVVLSCAAAAGLLLYRRKERSRLGEVVAAAALTGAAAPVGAASGLATWVIFVCWGVWLAQAALSAIAIHAMVARRPVWPTLLVTACVLVAGKLAGWPSAIALVPTSVVCVVVVSRLSVRSIKGIGVALTIAMLMSGVSLAVGLRT